MISTDRPEFEKQLAVLCASQDVPCTEARIEAFWRALQAMSLLQFVRTVDHMLVKESWARMPKPAQVWEAFKRMRASAPVEPKDDGFRGDKWDMVGNRFLMGHLAKTLAQDPGRYGGRASYRALQADEKQLKVLGLDKNVLDASPTFVANVQRLVAAKSAWAEDMRDMERDGGVDPEVQKAVWKDWIGRVEADIGRGKAA